MSLSAFWRQHGQKSGFSEWLWSCLSLPTQSSSQRSSQKAAKYSDTLGPSSYRGQERRLEGGIRPTRLGRTLRYDHHQSPAVQQTGNSSSPESGTHNASSQYVYTLTLRRCDDTHAKFWFWFKASRKNIYIISGSDRLRQRVCQVSGFSGQFSISRRFTGKLLTWRCLCSPIFFLQGLWLTYDCDLLK